MTALQARNPTPAECFQGLAAAMQRLGGTCDRTADAIMAEMGADEPDFERAASAIGVNADDLVDVFCEQMLACGFVIARRWTQ